MLRSYRTLNYTPVQLTVLCSTTGLLHPKRMQEQEQRSSLQVVGAKMQETAILSGRTEFYNDGGTTFEAEIPSHQYHEEPQLPDNTIEIRDSAISSLVVCSQNTKIDNSGAKISIKISDVPDAPQHPEGDVRLHEQPAATGGTNVIINSVVESHDTQIDMSGLTIHVQPRRGRSRRQPVQEGQINISNTASVNFVAKSVNTTIDTSNTDVNIE